MECIIRELKLALMAGTARAVNQVADSLKICLPARSAAASCALASVYDAGAAAASLAPSDFPLVLGASPVSRIEAQDRWLIYTLSAEFYSAAVTHTLNILPRPDGDLNKLSLNRLLMLAKRGGCECPADAAVQRAWLLALCAYRSPSALRQAERALLSMLHHVPPCERPALAAACGGVADASARILYHLQIGRR